MSDTVEDAKPNVENSAKKTVRPSIATVAAIASAADLLKQTVSAAEAKTSQAAASLSASTPQIGLRYAAIAACALVLGTAFGMVAAPKPSSVDTVGPVQTALDASRSETVRLSAEVERLGQALSSLREGGEAVRAEIRNLDKSFVARVGTLEQGFAKKLASLAESFEKAEREQTAQIAAQIEKRVAVVAPAPVAAVVAPVAAASLKAEPVATGAIADTKPKTETITGWALRDTYAGMAILEDRKRRLIEVARGDTVPGVGRVEAIERRGRMWVVVTRQGIITPQTW